MVSILNVHPHAFVLYEVDFGLDADATMRNKEFVAWLPETETLFGQGDNVAVSLIQCAQRLADHNFSYRVIGTKLLWLNDSRLAGLRDSLCVYIARDPRTWAMKNRICNEFYPLSYPAWRDNLLPPLTDYVKRLVMANALPNRLIITLEDLLADSQAVVAKLASFFSLQDCEILMRDWWQWTAWPDGDPKAIGRWQHEHVSATVPPKPQDTTVTIRPHPAWDVVLPVYSAFANDAPKTAEDCSQALAALSALADGPPARPEDLYESVESYSVDEA